MPLFSLGLDTQASSTSNSGLPTVAPAHPPTAPSAAAPPLAAPRPESFPATAAARQSEAVQSPPPKPTTAQHGQQAKDGETLFDVYVSEMCLTFFCFCFCRTLNIFL